MSGHPVRGTIKRYYSGYTPGYASYGKEGIGTLRHFPAQRNLDASGGKADIRRSMAALVRPDWPIPNIAWLLRERATRLAATENDFAMDSSSDREMTSSIRVKPFGALSSTNCIPASGPRARLRSVTSSMTGLRSAS